MLRVLLSDGGRHLQGTGYGRVARAVAQALSASELIDLLVTRPPGVAGEGVAPYRYVNPAEAVYDLVLQVGQPLSARRHPVPTILYTMVDTVGIPQSWHEALALVDGVLTPSTTSATTLGAVRPTALVPLGLDTSVFKPQPRWRSEGADKLSFLFVGTWSFRKGVDVLVPAFAEAFDAAEACLTLICTETDGDTVTNGVLDALRVAGRTADVRVVTKRLTDAWMVRYYARHDVFVTAARGEGWGYPAMEAAGCGLPVVAPLGSSMADFLLPDDNFWFATRQVPVSEVSSGFGSNFAASYAGGDVSILESDRDAVVKGLREAAAARGSLQERGQRSREAIARGFSEAAFAARLESELLAMAEPLLQSAAGSIVSDREAGALAPPAPSPATPPPLRLEIAAGDKPQEGYLHHDIRPLPHIDVVCDARSFPQEHKGRFDEVYASNILEHFNRFEVRAVLQEWASLLRPGGLLRVIVPDLEEISRQFVGGHIDHEFFVYLVYGGQDYEFNRHYYGFTPDAAQALFESVGLEIVKVKPGKRWEQRTTDRYCPMIDIVGRRP